MEDFSQNEFSSNLFSTLEDNYDNDTADNMHYKITTAAEKHIVNVVKSVMQNTSTPKFTFKGLNKDLKNDLVKDAEDYIGNAIHNGNMSTAFGRKVIKKIEDSIQVNDKNYKQKPDIKQNTKQYKYKNKKFSVGTNKKLGQFEAEYTNPDGSKSYGYGKTPEAAIKDTAV